MENLEKYIPLLIIAVSFVISIVNSLKKAKAQKEQIPPPPTSGRVVVPTNAGASKKSARSVSEKISPKEKEEIEPVYSSLPPGYLEDVVEESDSLLMEEDEKESGEGVRLQDIDEVKKAFIYSEILTRRYE